MKILIAGDFCPQDRVVKVFEQEQYDRVLGDVNQVIATTDYSIVNFECPVIKNGEKPIAKLGPNLNCSTNGMEAVKWVGFNCVTLANNHFCDYGDDGVINTLEACDKYGLDRVGGGRNIQEAAKTLYKQINGRSLAIINCCEHEFSIATDNTAGSNPVDPIVQYDAIKEARKNADYVLVIVHGGHELFQLPSLRMVKTYKFFIDAGADAVVNHHQHCFSGYEVYKEKPIFYGLGNFGFDNPTKRSGIWTEGYMVTIDFTPNVPAFEIHPYKQCNDEPRVVMLDRDFFNEKIEELNSIIADKDKLKTAIEEYYASSADQYCNIFEPIRNKYYFAAKQRGWAPSLITKERKLCAANYILCESHRDRLIHWLNIN